jgi:hypothetical protein
MVVLDSIAMFRGFCWLQYLRRLVWKRVLVMRIL